LRNAAILPASFTPGADSTPEETSTRVAPVIRAASATFVGSSPPESAQGKGWRTPCNKVQSNRTPMPPGSAAPSGVLAS